MLKTSTIAAMTGNNKMYFNGNKSLTIMQQRWHPMEGLAVRNTSLAVRNRYFGGDLAVTPSLPFRLNICMCNMQPSAEQQE